jgi:cytochrome c oxidase cbb3-type subunit I/II
MVISLETVIELNLIICMRSLGGLLFIIGTVMMFYNLIKTAKKGNFQADEEAEATCSQDLSVATGKEYWHRSIEKAGSIHDSAYCSCCDRWY